MDLHLAATAPAEAERQAVDAVLAGAKPVAVGAGTPTAGDALPETAAGGRVSVGGTRARHRVRHLLLPALHGVQDAIGWISPAALNYISERLGVPPAEAYGVATFYSLLSTTEQPPRVAHVCDDIACRGAGALELCRQLEQRIGPAHHAGGPAKAAHYGAPGHGLGTDSPGAGGAAKELADPCGAAAGSAVRTAMAGAATGGIATDAVAHGRPAAAGGTLASAAADEVAADAATLSGHATWVTSPCLGLCEAAPAVLLQLAGEPDDTLAPATADTVCAALAAAPATEGAAAVPAAGPAADAVPAAPAVGTALAGASSAPQVPRRAPDGPARQTAAGRRAPGVAAGPAPEAASADGGAAISPAAGATPPAARTDPRAADAAAHGSARRIGVDGRDPFVAAGPAPAAASGAAAAEGPEVRPAAGTALPASPAPQGARAAADGPARRVAAARAPATEESAPDMPAPGAGGGARPPAGGFALPAHCSVPQVADPEAAAELTLLRRVGQADPESLSDYRRHGGCAALRRAVALGPDGVLRELRDSKLQGRGGAAFPTAVKWEAVARAPARPHYVVCNADESEPGTFKDRVVMEQDPFALIEALVIAGFTTGATTGYLYIRGEYPLATRRLQRAIDQARDWGLLGRDIMGLGVDFDVELRRGAGAYICGEETALFNSLEGFRGEPRSKPPYPTEAGLFGKPTAVNNVETLINLLPIVLAGGRAYAAGGTEQSTGPKLFCLSGAVATPGVYEVEFGTTLRELLALAGGTIGGEPHAILLGGAAGSFVGPEHLDLPLTFEDTRTAGTTLGSGVVMPFAPGTDFLDITRRIAQFFRDESCGQCVPCRVGTVRQEEALQRLAAGGGAERGLLADLAQVMGDASICGLGHTAASALQSALRLGLLDGNGEG